MKRALLICATLFFVVSSSFAQDEAAIQQLSERFSKYVINNVVIHLKGIRFLQTTRKLQEGMNLEYTVELNKKGQIQDVKVINGVNEICDDDFRTTLFLMPFESFSDITITGKNSYIPLILNIKLLKCDKDFIEDFEDDFGRAKRWKRFKFTQESPEIKKYPKLTEYVTVKDQYYSSMWYIYFRLMHLKITLPELSETSK